MHRESKTLLGHQRAPLALHPAWNCSMVSLSLCLNEAWHFTGRGKLRPQEAKCPCPMSYRSKAQSLKQTPVLCFSTHQDSFLSTIVYQDLLCAEPALGSKDAQINQTGSLSPGPDLPTFPIKFPISKLVMFPVRKIFLSTHSQHMCIYLLISDYVVLT